MAHILMVLTSHDQLGDTGKKTGFWLEEFAAPYYVFKDAGAILRHRPFLGLRFIFSVIRITAEAMIVPGGNRNGKLNGMSVADNSGLQQQYTLSLGLDF